MTGMNVFLKLLQEKVLKLAVSVIALHGATPFRGQFIAEESVSKNVLPVQPGSV
jgi:hypothetical protein